MFFVLSYLSEAFAEYRRGVDDLMLLANLMGGASFLLFGIYGKYFYCETIEDKHPLFLLISFFARLISDSALCFCGFREFHISHGCSFYF